MSSTSDLITYNVSLGSTNVIVQQSLALTITVPPGSPFDDAAALALAAALEAACPASLGMRGSVNKSEIVETAWQGDMTANPPSFT